MKIGIYAIYDKKTKCFDKPWSLRFEEEAKRQFQIVREDKENKYGKNPEDFDLYLIAAFDDMSGEVEYTKPTFLM